MTDVAAAGEAPAVETIQTPPQPAGSSSERDFESEARDQGWRPKDEWTGKPENWKDAQTYVEWGESNNRIGKLEKLVSERVGKLEKVHSKTVEQLQRQHAEEISRLKQQKTAAVRAGDADTVDAIDKKLDELKAEAPASQRSPEEMEKVINAWAAERPWWSNKTIRAWAKEHSVEISTPDMTLEDNLALVDEAVRKEFPNAFKKPGAHGHAPVDGGGDTPSGSARSDPINALPNEARKKCKEDMAKFPKIYPTTAAWIAAYNS